METQEANVPEEAAFPPQSSSSPDSEKTPFTLVGKRIVIVEDEGITLMQLRRFLSREGMRVAGVANNGASAVRTVLEERPDIVLMDVQMPIMDGLEAARRILAEYRVCIVFLTAFATEEYREKAKAAGVVGYILKPYMPEALLLQLEQAWIAFRGS